MSPGPESRVSQGGEGRLRRVTPEENRRLNIAALRAGRSDVAQQKGWDLAHEELVAVRGAAVRLADAVEADEDCQVAWGGPVHRALAKVREAVSEGTDG